MKAGSRFIAGGGWQVGAVFGRPKLRRFGMLSLAWLLVALPATVVLVNGLEAGCSALGWTCVALIVPEAVFVVLTVVYWFTETPRTFTERIPNPDCDPQNLY